MSTEDKTPDSDDEAAIEAVRRHRVSLRRAMAHLAETIDAPAGRDQPEWCARVVADLDALANAWQTHIATTEGPDGLHEELVDYAPRLAHAVDKLKREHLDLAATVGAARDRVITIGESNDVEGARDALVDLLAGIRRHQHRGADLIYEAYNVDISTGD